MRIKTEKELPKTGHHDAADTASTEFIKAVKSEMIVISVKAKNIRGYPSYEVLQRYKRQNAKIHRTDRHGIVVITASIDGTYYIQ
jgi:competence protein ComEC